MAWSALPDGFLDFVNQPFLDYTGLSTDSLYGSGWKSAVHSEDIQRLETWWQNLRQSQESGTTEVRLRRFDGSHRWFLMFANPLPDESGNIVRWYGTNLDIEDRKRGEEGHRVRELSWRQIVDTIPGHVATTGATGEVEFLNRQMLEFSGKTSEELKDWSRLGIVHSDDLPLVIEGWATSIETGQILDIEARLRRADGVYRWFQVRGVPVRNTEGKISAWYVLLTDIEDLKRAEQKLRQSEQDLRTITDTIRQPIVVLAPDGTTLYANRVALDNSGLTKDEVKSSGFLVRVCHPDDVDRVLEERSAGLSKGMPFDSEMRVLFKKGQYRWQLLQYNPLKDESGQIIRWYVTATDIDHQKRTEEQLRTENLVLREEIDNSSMFEEIVGSCKPMRHVLKQVEKVAPSDSTVLILGDTGTGKELIARALHRI
jgi:formate hydrogenlyase transcriptional activator